MRSLYNFLSTISILSISVASVAAELNVKKDDFTKKTSVFVASTRAEFEENNGLVYLRKDVGSTHVTVLVSTQKSVNCRRFATYYKFDDGDAVEISADERDIRTCLFRVNADLFESAKTFAVRIPMFNAGHQIMTINISNDRVKRYLKSGEYE